MDAPLDLATVVGAYAVAISTILLAWFSYHWQAVRQRQLRLASVFELALLILFVSVVAAWLVQTPW
jgi:hypothetical protein